MNEDYKPFYVSAGDAPAKQKILVTALELFVKDGLCETSIRDIAKASGFTNPALFKHFSGKDALANYLFERCYLELFHLVASASKRGTTFASRHRAVVEAYLNALDRDRNSVLYVQEGLRHFWPRISAAARKHSILGEVRTLLQAGRKAGVVTEAIDIDLLVTAWVGTLQQFARARYFGEFRQSSKILAPSLNALLTKMVKV
jgi:TetR/AcrR family transcriptional regulator, repressor of fatR-cypB operon